MGFGFGGTDVRRGRWRVWLVALISACGVGLLVTASAAGNFVGVASDPAGDASDPSLGRDITDVGLAYDRRDGFLFGAVRFRGAPDDDAVSFVSLFAGVRTASGCNGYPAAGFGSYSDEFGASWLRLNDAAGSGPRGEADKRGGGDRVQRFEIAARGLAGLRLNCVIATVSEPNNSANVYDAAGPIALVGQPALAIRLGRVPRELPVDKPRTLKLVVSNPGDAPVRGVRLAIARKRGMTARLRPRVLRTLAAGGKRPISLTVTLGDRARFSTPLEVSARAGRLVARDEDSVYVRKPSKPPPSGGGGGGGGDGPTQLCNRWQPDLSGQTGGSLVLVPC